MKKNNILFIISFIIMMGACSKVEKSPIDYVDPMIGTGFHGHTYPGASAPFGAVQLSPDTRRDNWDACAGYHYSDSTIIGFSHTHLSGTGVADLGDILFHPTTKDFIPRSEGYIFDFLPFSHKDEKASAGYYSVNLKEEGVLVELTASRYAGYHKYTFSSEKEANIIIDMAHILTDEVVDSVIIRRTADNEITGMRRTQGWTPDQYIFFVAQFSKDFDNVKHINDGKILSDELPVNTNQQLFISFGESDGTPIVARVGISVVSEENARLNLESNNWGFDFDQAHNSVRKEWEDILSRYTIEGGKEKDMINFYTSVYHASLMPNIMSDVNGEFRRHNMIIDKVEDGRNYYSALSLWDTFRAWNPLQTLVDTDLVNDMIYSFIEMYNDTGELPIWPLSAGETGTMIGYHTASIIADAYMKGIRGYDIEKAFEALKVSSNINKKGSNFYTEYGYIPSNIKRESVSCALEYAYDDWCISQIAKELGKEDDYKYYTERAKYYINVFDGNTSFFRGKTIDGNWEESFDPFEPGRAYTEATAWQYRFFTPHDVNGLVQLMGGTANFINNLDDLFNVKSEIHGDMVDITGLIGQYAHGNEPSHHMAYLYSFVGQPWKTQEMTRRILDEMYSPTPEGISGNEDCGQISAWYILSSLGFYAVSPGSNEFVLTTPLFPSASVRLANGNTLSVKANNPGKNIYINRVVHNGIEITSNFITYQQLMEGGTLEFELSDKPNMNRGVNKEDQPYSLSTEDIVSLPYTSKNLSLFESDITVDLNSITEDAVIYYTLDSQEPDESSLLYEGPFTISENKTIKAKAYKDGYTPSQTFKIEATKAEYKRGKNVAVNANGINFSYYEGKFSSVYEMEKQKPIKSGVVDEPIISIANQEDFFGFIFEGVIEAPETGVYEFMTISDDGSVLYIDDVKVVDNDGSHAPVRASGKIALEKGYHTFKLMYFEDYEGEELGWGWRKPSDNSFQTIPKQNLYTK